MAGETYAADITTNRPVRATFLVSEKSARTTRQGQAYIGLRLMDRTGSLEGRIWDRVDELSGRFEVGDVVEVRGQASTYQGRGQISISELRRHEPPVSMEEFLPSAPVDLEDLQSQLSSMVRSIKDASLRHLLQAVFRDRRISDRFRRAPAGKVLHHAYLGGLLEHTICVAQLARKVLAHYEKVHPGWLDRDLLLSGALLHDLGKIVELEYDSPFGYTDEGRLLGHMSIGVRFLEEKASGMPGLDRRRLVHLQHLILSHHGELDYGAVVKPQTPEAMLLHMLDLMDSALFQVRASQEASPEGRWTDYARKFERYFFKGSIEETRLVDLDREGEGETGGSGGSNSLDLWGD